MLPRLRVVPPRVNSSGADVVELARIAGLNLDPWQAQVLDDALGEREDGKWSAFEVGLICPRQNGKGSILEAVELAALFLFGEKLILHSAHEFKTAREAFLRILTLLDSCDDLRKQVAPRGIKTSHGEEGIELRNGARLRFVARSTGSGRGFSGDRIILDEAYNLGSDAMAALLPTMSARPNPQLWYTSSAGMATSEQLQAVRKRALTGESFGLCYLDYSADPYGLDLDDRQAWAQANPALGIRISMETIERERAALGDSEFARERLGIWDEVQGVAVVPGQIWSALADRTSQVLDPVTFAVDVSPDRETASIGIAGKRSDKKLHVEVVDNRKRTGWLIPRLLELVTRWNPTAIVVDVRGPASSLIPDLQREDVPLLIINTAELSQACGQLYDAVMQDQLRHLDQQALNAALAMARKRPLGDAWAWHRQSTTTDLTPLVAVTLALYGHLMAKPKKGGAVFF